MSSVAPLDNDNYRTTISTMTSEAPLDKDNYGTTISTLRVILILWGFLLESIYIIVIFIYDFKTFQKQHFLNQLICVHQFSFHLNKFFQMEK